MPSVGNKGLVPLPTHPQLSLYQQHKLTWVNGCGATICPKANLRCYARGILPCDILFVGEAPGPSENLIGKPFVGPAGKLLDTIIQRAVPSPLTHALTNLVCCMPTNEQGHKEMEPDDDSIRQCQHRLLELIILARPKLIVGVGALARDYLDQGYQHAIKLPYPMPIADIKHPAYILRANIVMRGLLIQSATVTLRNAIHDHLLINPATFNPQG